MEIEEIKPLLRGFKDEVISITLKNKKKLCGKVMRVDFLSLFIEGSDGHLFPVEISMIEKISRLENE